jgi:hypothetical protein
VYASSAVAALLAVAPSAGAAPTQEDVFRSIQHNVGGGGGGEVDATLLLVGMFGLIAVVVVVSLVNRYRARAGSPKARNHQGKLLREVLKAVPLKGREVKQLKLLADHAEADGPLASPLTLLLCPSLMAKTIQTGKRVKFDRRALLSVARKAGLQVTKR